MVSKEELEDKLHDEEVEEIWRSIKNSKRIKKAQADEKFWREHLDPFYDEMLPHIPAKAVGEVVRKEIEEYEKNDPIFAELDKIESINLSVLAGIGLFYIGIGILFLIGMVYSVYHTECVVAC